MIYIGLKDNAKRREIAAYVQKHGIKKVFVFYPEKFPLNYKEARHIEYKEIIMYRTFYPLLEEIGQDSLLVFNEVMRTQKRGDLTYNCAHHYCNQTPHKLVFQNFPFIEDKNDFMILLDLLDKDCWKGKTFDYACLQSDPVQVVPIHIKLKPINVEISDKDQQRYSKKRDSLFDSLGEKEPETIPRALQLFAGDLKKSAIEDSKTYVARNKRFKRDNILTYDDIRKRGDYIVIDTHWRRINMNDFLQVSGLTRVKYLSTVLPIDTHITTEFMKWTARLEAFYAQASLYQR
jgi:hypothetical protein